MSDRWSCEEIWTHVVVMLPSSASNVLFRNIYESSLNNYNIMVFLRFLFSFNNNKKNI